MIAFNIEWETDGYNIDLPSEVEIPSYIDESFVADYLSDEFGYLVNSFELDIDY